MNSIRFSFLFVMPLFVGCPGGSSTTTSSTTTQTTATTQTTGTTETSTTKTVTTSKTTTATTTTADYPGWQIVETDEEAFAVWGYTIQTWEIGPEWKNYYQAPIGVDRRFYLVVPSDLEADEKLDVLTMFHGAVVDDDSDPKYYTGKDPFETYCGEARDSASQFYIAGLTYIPFFVAERGWALLIPENLWCDFWVGRGPEDPVDTVNHRSYEHVAEVLDFVSDGGPGFSMDNLYVWGSSAGGVGATATATWYDGVDGLVVDSSPCDMAMYYSYDSGAMRHIFGGPPYAGEDETPSPEHQNYLDASCNYQVSSEGLRVPIAHTYNTYDVLTALDISESLESAVADNYTSASNRSFSHNFSHFAPGQWNHGQSRARDNPFPYYTLALFRFLEGKQLVIQEAESSCLEAFSTCTVGESIHEDPNIPWANHSNGGGRELLPGAVGYFFDSALPEEVANLADGTPVIATAVLEIESDVLDPKTQILTINYIDALGASQEVALYAGDFTEEVAPIAEPVLHQLNTTQISFLTSKGGRIRIHAAGAVMVRLDSVIYQF